MLQRFDRSGGLQSFLLGRELLRERRRLPEIIEENTHAENKAPEARFFLGGNQVGLGVANVCTHDIYVYVL